MTTNGLPNDGTDQLGNLIHYLPASPRGMRSLALVSGSREEGTSTATANLGRYLAVHWSSKVLIVDANLRHPSLHDLAQVEREPGLVEVLDGTVALAAAVKKTGIATLFVLPAGREAANPNRILDPAALEDRLIRASSSFDFVLVDCPPVNLYLEAVNVARLCDGVILVVEGEKTRREAAESARAQLARAECKLLGVFMNKRKFYIPKAIYDRI
jgi:capsular exopolysaccharide synthesis family protein